MRPFVFGGGGMTEEEIQRVETLKNAIGVITSMSREEWLMLPPREKRYLRTACEIVGKWYEQEEG